MDRVTETGDEPGTRPMRDVSIADVPEEELLEGFGEDPGERPGTQ